MTISHSALNTELTTDPQNLGYVPYVLSGNDAALVSLINAVSDSISVKESEMGIGDFQLSILPAILLIDTLDAPKKAKWVRVLQVIQSVSVVHLERPEVQALFGMAVTDGLLTPEQAESVGRRTGSRAEQLFGAGAVVNLADVSFALRGR